MDLEISHTSCNLSVSGIRHSPCAINSQEEVPLCLRHPLYTVSCLYVHELQMEMEKGVLNQGLVDITSTSDLDFFNYLDGNLPIIKVFTNDLARQHAAKAKVQCIAEELRKRKVKLVSAPCDEAYFYLSTWIWCWDKSSRRSRSSRDSAKLQVGVRKILNPFLSDQTRRIS